MTGYMYNEVLGKLHFWLTFIGANVLFFPQHSLATRSASDIWRPLFSEVVNDLAE